MTTREIAFTVGTVDIATAMQILIVHGRSWADFVADVGADETNEPNVVDAVTLVTWLGY